MLTKIFGKQLGEQAKEQALFLVPALQAEAPADLADNRFSRHLDASGQALVSSVSDKDLTEGFDTHSAAIGIFLVWMTMVFSSPAIAFAVAFVSSQFLNKGFAHLAGKEQMGLPGIIFIGLCSVLAFAVGIALPPYNWVFPVLTTGLIAWVWIKGENMRADYNSALAGVLSADSSSDAVSAIKEAEAEREAQNARALADETPFFEMALASGYFSQKGDIYAAERGQVVGLTEADLETHLFSLGATGTGKTATLLRPLYKWWEAHGIGGALILDGKGDLPSEFAESNEDFFLLDPTNPDCNYNLIAGLAPDEIASVIVETMADPESKNDFWTGSAGELIKYAALLLDFARAQLQDEDTEGYYAWNLANLLKAITSEDYRAALVGNCSNNISNATPLTRAAYDYLSESLPKLADDTKSGIIQTATSLLAPIASQESIYRWANATTGGYNIESVLQGNHVGIATPSYKYGRPGLAVQALAKARIYRAIRQRGSKWRDAEGQTKVLMIMDECQELLSEQDDIFAVARSLGLSAVCATQTFEGLQDALGLEKSKALLGNFRNLVCFASSKETYQYVADRFGGSAIRTETENLGLDYNKLLSIADAGGVVQQLDMGKKDMAEKGSSAVFKSELKAVTNTEELSYLLSSRFYAATLLNRAGAPRRSVAQYQIGGVSNG